MLSRKRNHVRLTIGKMRVLPFYARPVVLTGRELEKHKWILGTSGAGKSKFNAGIAADLIMQGQACSVVDPHADLVHDILAILYDRGYFSRQDCFKTLRYVEFARPGSVIPFNVLQQPYSPQTTVLNLIEAVMRVFPALTRGAAPNFQNILQYSAMVLTQNNLPITLITRLLKDADFREELLQNCTHADTREFFATRFASWDKKQRNENVESTLNKISIFTFTDHMKHALGASENRLNFRELMDQGTSVLFNLGNLEDETRHLLGSLIMVGFEQATKSRATLREHERKHYHILVDEFPQFSSRSEEAFTAFLSEARKFKVTLWLSHQTGMQISQRFQSALQNALPIFFQTGQEDAQYAARIFGKYDPLRVKHTVQDEDASDRTHPVFWGLHEQWQDMADKIVDLPPREAYTKLRRGIFRGGTHTVRFRSLTVQHRTSWEIIEYLRQGYADWLLVPFERLSTPLSVPAAPSVRRVRVVQTI